MPTISCIIYDLDGTLIDSAADITVAVNRLRDSFGLDALDESLIRNFIGDGPQKLLERAIIGLVDDKEMRPLQRLPKSAVEMERLLDRFRGLYFEMPAEFTTRCSGAKRMLKHWQAQGTAQVLLTNKPHDLALEILERLEILEFFDLVIGRGAKDDDGNILAFKPDPAVVEHILDETGAERDETVMIGDGLADVMTAKNAEIRPIVILEGYGDANELVEALGSTRGCVANLAEADEVLRHDHDLG